MSAKQQLNLPGIEKVNMQQVYGRHKESKVKESNAFKAVMAIVDHVKKHGIAPYEGYTVLDMAEIKKTDPELAKMKTVFPSFVTAVKAFLKEQGAMKELTVIARGNSKVYLGNMEE